MPYLLELERLMAVLRMKLWSLVWLLESRPDIVVLIIVSFILAVLLITVQRKIAFDKVVRYRVTVWRNSQAAVVHKRTASESLGLGCRYIIAVITTLILFVMWFVCQVVIFLALAVESPALEVRPGFAILPIGLSVVGLLLLITIHTIFVSRKRATIEMDDRIGRQYTIAGATLPTLGPREPNKYYVGYGTNTMIVVVNILYFVGMIALYAWIASLAA